MKDLDARMVLGFLLVFLLFVLTMAIALGKVDEAHSYGLPLLLECFKNLAIYFAAWAFHHNDRKV
jgi:hypothetical protein